MLPRKITFVDFTNTFISNVEYTTDYYIFVFKRKGIVKVKKRNIIKILVYLLKSRCDCDASTFNKKQIEFLIQNDGRMKLVRVDK